MGVKGRPVYGVLFGIELKDAPDPLQLFELSPFSESEFLRVVEGLNELSGDQKLSETRVKEEFARYWPEVMSELNPILRSVRKLRPLRFRCEELETRADMYDRIAELLECKTQGWVHDTTWGRNPPDKLVKRERQALERYLTSRQRAVESGVSYKELFSFTLERIERLRDAILENFKEEGYEIRVLERGFDLSLPDFFVTNKGELIISHVDATPAGGRRKYLYVECEPLADLYHDWFEECWECAAEPRRPT
jgi:hypothetical protein